MKRYLATNIRFSNDFLMFRRNFSNDFSAACRNFSNDFWVFQRIFWNDFPDYGPLAVDFVIYTERILLWVKDMTH